MKALSRSRQVTSCPTKAYLWAIGAIVFLLIFLTTTQSLQAGHLRRIENAMLSPTLAIPLSVGWGFTTYDILSNRNEFYGERIGNEQITYWTDHLHLGYGLYSAGFLLKHCFPSLYQKLPYGARFLFCCGSIIQLDDMYQHLYLQRHDGFDLDESMTGPIAESPLHRLYVWAEQPERTDDHKVMLDLISFDRLTFSVGFYQGPAGELSYRILDFSKRRAALQLKNIIGIGFSHHNEKEKRLGIEQVVTGFSLMLYLNEWCALELGSGLRLYSNNPYLNDPVAIFYGIQLGARPGF